MVSVTNEEVSRVIEYMESKIGKWVEETWGDEVEISDFLDFIKNLVKGKNGKNDESRL